MFLIEDSLGFPCDPAVVSSPTICSRESIVKGSIETGVGVCGGDNGVEVSRFGEVFETAVVVGDFSVGEERREVRVCSDLESEGRGFLHAEEVNVGEFGWGGFGGRCLSGHDFSCSMREMKRWTGNEAVVTEE